MTRGRWLSIAGAALSAAAVALVQGCSDGGAFAPTDPSAGVRAEASAAEAPGIPDHVTVMFGQEQLGSPFPRSLRHDLSVRAASNIYPREVVIRRGGSVTFEVERAHQVAIYAPWTKPSDIDIAVTELIPGPIGSFGLTRIIDPDGLVHFGQDQQLGEHEETTRRGTFHQPGRYLVICTTSLHFVRAKMYGWITVK